jgi:hypothetical protein
VVRALEDGFEYGYSEHEETLWCIRRNGADSTLCGRDVGFFPVAQPANPDPVCRDCRQVLAAKPETGTCQACGFDAPMSGGRVRSHTNQGMPCVGANMRPKGWQA